MYNKGVKNHYTLNNLIRKAGKKLEAASRDLEGSGDIQSIDQCRDVMDALLHKEEIFWRQRSKALWLKKGDHNTKYFHAVASK